MKRIKTRTLENRKGAAPAEKNQTVAVPREARDPSLVGSRAWRDSSLLSE
jgi:hypothetical protein